MRKQDALAQLVDAARHLVRLTSQDPILREATPQLEARALEALTQAVAAYDATEAATPKHRGPKGAKGKARPWLGQGYAGITQGERDDGTAEEGSS